MTLIDTSVFVEFFKGNPQFKFLQQLFSENEVVLHPFVEGELLLGGLNQKNEILLEALPKATLIQGPTFKAFIRHYQLSGKGLGFVDCHLIASAKADAHRLLTHDKALRAVAEKLDLA